jgi:hypothetical protein
MFVIVILLIGFSRPENTIRQLVQLFSMDLGESRIILSLDGPRDGNNSDLHMRQIFKQKLKQFENQSNFSVVMFERNLGVDKHVGLAIDAAFENASSLLVLEDDIVFTERSLESILELMAFNFKANIISPIVGMSLFALPNWRILDVFSFWRHSIYFTAWGFALHKDFWHMHRNQIELRKASSASKISTKNWNLLSERQKALWMQRFKRDNYDYQIQRTLFELDICSIAPSARIFSNIGFADGRATHTGHFAPWFLRRGNIAKSIRIKEKSSLSFRVGRVSRFWQFSDSNSWAGDGLMTTRGRTFGLRTILNRALKKEYFKDTKISKER